MILSNRIFFVTETMNLEYRTDELYRQAEETTILISLVRRQSDNTVSLIFLIFLKNKKLERLLRMKG